MDSIAIHLDFLKYLWEERRTHVHCVAILAPPYARIWSLYPVAMKFTIEGVHCDICLVLEKIFENRSIFCNSLPKHEALEVVR